MMIARSLALAFVLVLAGALAKAAPTTTPSSKISSPLDEVKMDTSTLVGTEGFFRVGKSTGGRWWLVDPEGRPFYYRGVTSINRAGRAGGRLAQAGLYADAVDKKYDYQKSPKPFVDSVIGRLREWNFNALGAWATEEFYDQGMPYTEIMEFRKIGPNLPWEKGVKLPDVYDPEWAKVIDEQAKKLCTPRKDSRQLVGYFTDNEMTWAQIREEDIAAQSKAGEAWHLRTPALLQICLSLPEKTPARAAAIAFVVKAHGDEGAVAKAWGVDLKGKALGDAVRGLSEAEEAIASPGYVKDQTAFSREFARRYFQMSAEAIRKYDPNHLILGCRFGGPPGDAVLAECKRPWVDVLSANNYRPNMFERMDIYHRAAGMPVIVGEFAWYSGNFVTGNGGQRDVGGMLKKGQASLEELFTHPGVVGYTWYRWVDTSSRDEFRPVGDGLVSITDETSHTHVDVLQQVNARAEEIAVHGRKK